ncbi:hypothetical protein NHQ30_008378 [Ciborinia camelliae]|nr:hypothetical protein NHQ30_008378 [Ciborinia camelliae]
MADTRVDNQDCSYACTNARRKDGTSVTTKEGLVIEGTYCFAGGSYKCATWFQQSNRARCV